LNLNILISDREGIEQNINRRVKDALRYLALSSYAVLLPSVFGALHMLFFTPQTKLLLKVSIGILWIVILYINLSMIIALWKADFRPKFKKELVDYAFYFAVLWLLFEKLDVEASHAVYTILTAIFIGSLFYIIASIARYMRMMDVLVFPVSLYSMAFAFRVFTISMGFVLLGHETSSIRSGFIIAGYFVFTVGLIDVYLKLREILSKM
jgi:hypothetical protein